MKKQILFQGTTLNELVELLAESNKSQVLELFRKLNNKEDQTELLTRTEACELLKIDSSTLWAWSKKGKIKAYGISNRRYYKRTELLECLTPLK
ncbi:helix-turn-helix domain-containing protein [Psychroserpens burtonensis]|uniref:helix-turn-helix domain-containing protein n=1 Tax=Psychroserpens burtonensis TaxID=49278 RepID=UPI000417983C|nr:helix-turn-helix domain-containing protein [Psychroserpens burtonensis]